MSKSVLRTVIGGLSISNPLMNASGVLSNTPGLWRRLYESGAGAIVTKSVGLTEREPYPGPNVVEIECGLLNAMGLPNPGVEILCEELKAFKMENPDIIVIVSVFGANADEFTRVASSVEEAGADAIELNLSCPHAKGYGAEIGSNPKTVKEVVSNVKSVVKVPVFPKLTPNVTSIVEIADAALSGGADGIVAINSVKGIRINVELMRPVLGNVYGGYTGIGILPIGIRAVWDIYEEFECDIIGVGGIESYKHVLEYILAGAKAVQIGTALYKRGLHLFREIKDSLEKWLQEHNINELNDIIGLSHRR